MVTANVLILKLSQSCPARLINVSRQAPSLLGQQRSTVQSTNNIVFVVGGNERQRGALLDNALVPRPSVRPSRHPPLTTTTMSKNCRQNECTDDGDDVARALTKSSVARSRGVFTRHAICESRLFRNLPCFFAYEYLDHVCKIVYLVH